ncbi:MAG: 2TM domain-containing protein [Gammaproteobacteria bacterium]|nr:2TM domain-containing protein [Gammaproteobacteria bacterium]MBU1442837.1 2TM domain-containing protein [Gammaproteobacteria bacterium]MBU2287247.1 2TM domain-containing protein [Gammaproteobacteria bacterium]MBU2407858.1 2TM domain-containing protein [Gammaproteobacteria bacterium]
MKTDDLHTDPIERLARRRAGAKMGWFIHATVYVLVNLLLVFISASRGQGWAVYPLMGWGLGLLIHGAVVFFVMPGGNFYDRLVARERKALAGRDRW